MNQKSRSKALKISRDADKSGGSALARGIHVLQAFSAEMPAMTARELMAATGLPKPTLFRLVTTLCEAGLLRYEEADGRFMPSPGLARLAAPLLARIPIRQLAFGPMQALAERVCAQVSLGLGMGLDLVFIELAQSRDCVTVRPAMGSHISLSRTASGRAYLAALPAGQAERYVEGLSAIDPEQGAWLAERLQETRRDLAERGFCVSHGDLQRQLEAVAVPLRSAGSTDEIYVFACTVPSFELRPGQLMDDVGPRLVTLARSIEAALGAPPVPGARFFPQPFLAAMNFDLSDDQQAVCDGVARICSRFDDDYWLKKDKECGFPFELHQALAEAGWLGICIPEEYGGSGLGITEAAQMMQTISASGAGMSGASAVHMNIFGLSPEVIFCQRRAKAPHAAPVGGWHGKSLLRCYRTRHGPQHHAPEDPGRAPWRSLCCQRLQGVHFHSAGG